MEGRADERDIAPERLAHQLYESQGDKDEDIRRLKSAIRDVEDQLADVIRDVQMASYEADARNWEDATYLVQEAADNLK